MSYPNNGKGEQVHFLSSTLCSYLTTTRNESNANYDVFFNGITIFQNTFEEKLDLYISHSIAYVSNKKVIGHIVM